MKALTIVHVAPFPFGLRPGFQHSVSVKLSNGMVRNGHLVLNFADRDVARALAPFGHRKLGRRPANGALIGFCRHHRPDVVLFGHADTIEPATVAALRDLLPGVKMAQWNVDPLFEADNIRRLNAKLPLLDATFVTTAGPAMRALRQGGRVAFMPNPVDLSIERGRCDLADSLPFDLFYACGHPSKPPRQVCGRDWDMNAFMSSLLAQLPGVRPLLGGLLGHPKLTGAGYQSALESCAMGLNISRRADSELYSSDRIAHLAGNGQVVLIERATGYADIFSDQEMGFFSSIEGLVAMVAALAADPARRKAMASAGRARYVALFNERAVAQRVLDILLNDVDPDDLPWKHAG